MTHNCSLCNDHDVARSALVALCNGTPNIYGEDTWLSTDRILDIKRNSYIILTAVAAALFVAISFYAVQPEVTRSVIVTAIVLTAFSLVFELGINFPLLIKGSTSFSTVSYMAMIFLLPFPLPVIGALVVLLSDLRERKPWQSLLFNPANYALTFGISSLVWWLYAGNRTLGEIPFSVSSFLILMLIVVLFYSINVFLLNGYLAIASRRPFSYLWISQDLDLLLPYASLQVVGVLFALAWEDAPIIIPILVVPAVTTYIAFETIQRLQRQTQEAMIAMADAIDARDVYTAEHSHRVTKLAVRVAEVHGLKARDIDRIELAARVHDIGKIGISDAILNKKGPLDEEEWALMQGHPVIGENLLRAYRQFRHEAAIVRSHHERWDGRGYPDKIRGAQIPIGARIIAVADTFDAMTSERPYRGPLSSQVAIEEIRSQALSQFDPQVVASFLQVMDELSKVRPISTATTQSHEEEKQPQWYSSLP